MKKILVLALIFTGLSINTFSEEKTITSESKQTNQTERVDGPVSCVAGMTTCGISYQYCFPEEREVSSEEQANAWEQWDFFLCVWLPGFGG